MFANTRKMLKKPMICFRIRKKGLFIYSDDSRHVETVVLLSRIKGNKSIQVDIDLNEVDLTKAESKATYLQIQDYVEKNYDLKVSSLYTAYCIS